MGKTKVELNGKTILVTGSPGFVGANLVVRLLKEMTDGKRQLKSGIIMIPFLSYFI